MPRIKLPKKFGSRAAPYCGGTASATPSAVADTTARNNATRAVPPRTCACAHCGEGGGHFFHASNYSAETLLRALREAVDMDHSGRLGRFYMRDAPPNRMCCMRCRDAWRAHRRTLTSRGRDSPTHWRHALRMARLQMCWCAGMRLPHAALPRTRGNWTNHPRRPPRAEEGVAAVETRRADHRADKPPAPTTHRCIIHPLTVCLLTHAVQVAAAREAAATNTVAAAHKVDATSGGGRGGGHGRGGGGGRRHGCGERCQERRHADTVRRPVSTHPAPAAPAASTPAALSVVPTA